MTLTAIPHRRLAGIALLWAVLYGAVRGYWQSGHMPDRMSPVGYDLVAFTGWASVGLCAAAALVSAVLLAAPAGGPGRRVLPFAAWAVGLALVASSAMLLLDVVGLLLPGVGVRFYPLGAASRAACAGMGAAVGLAALSFRRRARGACLTCGKTAPAPIDRRTPAWAWWAAYLAVAGCLARLAAQLAFDGGRLVEAAAAPLLFEAGFLLAGIVLPLALVHSWGRVWPLTGGRRVPRPLVLWPAAGVSAGLIVYFGLMQLQMISERLQGRNPFPPDGGLALPETFFWLAVPGYLLWGVGLAIATVAFARRTRRPCTACG
ncbi:hypothetical protein [Actinomadura macrotermitis]|uniref:Uncharacterized protein n=1 Tax=Actinomadura macrotermitis TaxID=2585200 RepID=A0A7K0C4J9_9ACTN|nr:hypothetical protein [Actinomadura macrotermitis]MQY08371.1 hypothetical protein [Actinomadura macrotermitis]